MVQKLSKLVVSLLLIIALLVVCITALAAVFIGAWLHTYHAFTDKTLVAEVVIESEQTDAQGTYSIVKYRPIQQDSALIELFLQPRQPSEEGIGAEQIFKVYADSIHIGGPMVKFRDNLTLLNFKTIYKVGLLFGRYNFDPEKENKRTQGATFELNGGIDPIWRDIKERNRQWPYNVFFETTQFSTPGVSTPTDGKPDTYDLFMTDKGFLWVEK